MDIERPGYKPGFEKRKSLVSFIVNCKHSQHC